MIKKFSDYQKLAVTTAKYPKKYKIIYPTFELIDETIEFKTAQGKDNQIKELGDCFWPFANLTNELALDIDGIYDEAIEVLKDDLFDDINDAIDAIDSMVEASAKICGRVKKWLRDEDTKQPPSDDKMIEIEFQLIHFMAAMIYICGRLKVSWQEVAQINIDKLFSRKKRGKISGSGDNR
jgi:hypothetical protein